jgi:polysaccharide biosynthesis protein PslH
MLQHAERNDSTKRLDRQPARRLLFLLPFPPRLDATDGGGRATAQLLTKLAARHHIALLYLRDASDPPLDEILQKKCELVEEVMRPDISYGIAQRWSRLTSVLGGTPLWATGLAVKAYGERVHTLSRSWEPDIVQIEYHVMGQYLTALDGCPAPRVLTEHEPGTKAAHDLWQSHRGVARVIRHLDLHAWKRFERTIVTQVQAIVVFTESDRQAVTQLTQRTPIVRIPLGTMLSEHPLNPLGSEQLSLLFVGNFRHPPNAEAAVRLISTIFPRVRARFPELVLNVVGDQPTSRIRQMANDNIIVTGRVPDVTPYLDRAALVVVPLRLGGGMRVKVLEALAAGKAVIASPLAIEGLDLVDGEHVILAETDQQFSEAIVELLIDPVKRASLAACARAWACANLGWEKSITAYEELYESLLERTLAER